MFGEYSPIFAIIFPVALVVTMLGAIYVLTDAPPSQRRETTQLTESQQSDGLPAFEFVLGKADKDAPAETTAAGTAQAPPPAAPHAKQRKKLSAFGEEFFHASRRGEKKRDQAGGRGSSSRAAVRLAEERAAANRPTLTRGGLKKANSAKGSGGGKPTA